jgi:glucan phosphoethanolaminetransferase (alkaline phosphatase superfamily)
VGIRIAYPAADTGYTFARDILDHLDLKFFAGSSINAILPHAIEVPIAFYVVYGMMAVVMLCFAKDVWKIAKRNPSISLYFLVLSAISFMGSYDNARCAVYGFIPVLYVCCSIMESHEAFFRRWYVLISLISLQIYGSNLFNLNPADYAAYMPHYMTGEQAIGYFYLFVFSVGVMVACRQIYRWERRGDTAVV